MKTKLLFTFLASMTTYLFGGIDGNLHLFGWAFIANYVAGYLLARKNGTYDRSKIVVGLAKFALICLAVILANRVDYTKDVITHSARNGALFVATAYYIKSFTENLGSYGVPIFKQLSEFAGFIPKEGTDHNGG